MTTAIIDRYMFYSPIKFAKLKDDRKVHLFLIFIEKISSRWNDYQERLELVANFRNCLATLNETFIYSNWKQIAPSLKNAETLEEFLYITKDIWHNHGRAYYDSEIEVDELKLTQKQQDSKLPLYVVLENLRSAFNVGSIIRSGECFGVTRFYFCGYTPVPDNDKVKKTSRKTDSFIEWEHRQDIIPLLRELKQTKTIIALETEEEAQIIYEVKIPQPAVLILGNEALGVSKPALNEADIILKIPVQGWKNSFNVATAFGIACYEIFRQWKNK